MTGFDIAILLIGFTGMGCYLWGYEAGSKFTLKIMNEKLDAIIEELDRGDK